MTGHRALRLFEGFGVELEYMIVGSESLAVLPIADALLHAASGSDESEIEIGPLCWSNELVLHVVEFKTNGPVVSLSGLSSIFDAHVAHANALLAPLGGRLLPTAMHPWMDPLRETHLWPHENTAIYRAFDRIFDCRGHGWSNVQSIHLNLPFADDAEFARLHAAVRLVLPILPALAASSPVVERRQTGLLDNRLEYYRHNCARVPEVTGRVVPEQVFSTNDYHAQILERMYGAMAPLDPEGTLRDEWLNARGAIARFVRNTIEIRVLDMQECPAADVAILAACVAVLRALVAERWCSLEQQQAFGVETLESVLLATIRDGEAACISDRRYLAAFGLVGLSCCRAGQLWQHLVETLDDGNDPALHDARQALSLILRQGTLARRILRTLEQGALLETIYRSLAECLAKGHLFEVQT